MGLDQFLKKLSKKDFTPLFEHLPDCSFVFRKIPANDLKLEGSQNAGVAFALKEKFK